MVNTINKMETSDEARNTVLLTESVGAASAGLGGLCMDTRFLVVVWLVVMCVGFQTACICLQAV